MIENSLMRNTKKAKAIVEPVVVGGLIPLTTIDYPDHLSAVLFLQGCPWQCGYCQNGGLLPRKTETSIPWQDIIDFLCKRQHLLEAVVFSGGEPTLQSQLAEAIQQVKSMGFKIGLHTAGIYPKRLESLLPLLDWVGMDIKADKADYESITKVKGSGERAWQSAKLLQASGVAHEFRTTVHHDMLNHDQLKALVDSLANIGAEDFVIQDCIVKHCLDESLRQLPSVRPEKQYYDQFSKRFKRFSIRQL